MDEHELGKLLLEKRVGAGNYFVGILLIALGCLLLAGLFVEEELKIKIFACVMGPLMIGSGIFMFPDGGKKLRVYERGIVGTKVVIPFEQISSYSFSVTNVLNQG